METCGPRLAQRVVFVLVLSILKSTNAGTFAPGTDTDNSIITGTYIFANTRDSEETTNLLRRLITSTQVFSRKASTDFPHSTTGKISDTHPSFSDTEAQTATDQSSFSTDTKSWTALSNQDTSTVLLSPGHKNTDITGTEREVPSSVSVVTTNAYLGLSRDRQPRTETRTVRDLTVTELTEQETTDTDTIESTTHINSTYISIPVSHAGERTLRSITINSISPYTEDSSSSETNPRTLTWDMGSTGATRGRHYPGGSVSTKVAHTMVTSDDHAATDSTQGSISQSEEPSISQGTPFQTGQPNVTGPGLELTSHSNLNSTLPLTVPSSSEDGMDTTADSSISKSYTISSGSASSSPPVVSPENTSTNMSYRGSETTATETPTGPGSTSLDEELYKPQTHVEETTMLRLTTAPPALRDVATTVDESLSKFLSGQQPFIPQTHRPAKPTELLTTAEGQVTQKPQVTQASTTVPVTPTTQPSDTTADLFTTRQLQPSSTLDTHMPHTTLATTETTQLLTTPTLEQHSPTSRSVTPPQSPSSSQPGNVATDVSTLHLETSTATPGNTTTHRRHTTASFTKSATTSSTVVVTTGRHTDRSTTETETTTRIPVEPTSTPGNLCEPHTCVNGGTCVPTPDHGYRCECLPAWTGVNCTEDVDECVRKPCPQDAECVNTRGSFSCECPLGYDLEDGRSCTQAKTFLGVFRVNSSLHLKSNALHEVHKEILQLLNVSLSILHGYRRSTLKDKEGLCILAVNMFSMSANLTSIEVYNSIQMTLRNCSKTHSHCTLKLHRQLTYQGKSLCLEQKNRCETQYSVCNDTYGTPFCQCHEGYFKKNPEDTTCRDCGDGFQRVNGTCVKCPFGFGGFNCKNFDGLIAKVVSPAAGGLLLIVIIALIVTCCRKDKNDINKIIFKSGDLQMSPYAEFPKSNRVSMEWGRETIEMQENGSTKNLLQMTDIYYSPALRNADLDRNCLYPFSGLPGSRHSCIYPAQWNPSFINDDSRRRDYF